MAASVTFGSMDFINNLTRGMMDDEVNQNMLAESNTALYLMYRNPIQQPGAYAVANVVYKRKTGKVVSTGQYTYNQSIDPPHIQAKQGMVMATLEYGVDGYDFESATGRDLESVVSGGEIPRAHARAFVNAYREELISAQGDMARHLNNLIINGGDVAAGDQGSFGANSFVGLKQLSRVGATYGGLAASNLGDHNFDGFTAGVKAKQWAPASKRLFASGSGTPLSLGADGDFANMMRQLNHGASQIAPSQAFAARFVGLVSQTTRNRIIEVLGDKIRRPITENSGASTDITGFRKALMWDEFNLELHVDTRIEDDEIIVWNPACIRLAENNADRRYAKGWIVSTTQYTAVLPFRKRVQLWCCDLSQIGALYDFSSITE